MSTDNPEYHASVMALVTRLNDAMNTDIPEYSVRVNALLTLLALAGKQSTLTEDEFHAVVGWQLSEIMSRMSVVEGRIQ
jgi:hypothetical protein